MPAWHSAVKSALRQTKGQDLTVGFGLFWRRCFKQQACLGEQIEHGLPGALFITRANRIGDLGVVCGTGHGDRLLPVRHLDRDSQGNVDRVAHIKKEPVAAGLKNGDMKFNI